MDHSKEDDDDDVCNTPSFCGAVGLHNASWISACGKLVPSSQRQVKKVPPAKKTSQELIPPEQ